jgi:deoxyribodipyrimidine photo-lyase
MKTGIFIFRRDLRLIDNLALLELDNNVDKIIPVFILDTNQVVKNKSNENYFSNNVVQFMCESLLDLNKQLNNKLNIFYGSYELIIKEIINELNPQIISFNNDFSIYAIKRDEYIINQSKNNNIDIITNKDDLTLNDIDKIVENKGSAFKQYGAFYKISLKNDINKPSNKKINKFIKITNTKIKYLYDIDKLKDLYIFNKSLAQNGGRSIALDKLNNIKIFKDYNDKRDLLNYHTTNLSAYLNFGCLSCREVYWKITQDIGASSLILKQLFWRDYFLQAFKYLKNAKEYDRHMNLDRDYDRDIKWKNNKEDWKVLIESKTGFLIVDACMNEMKTTGFMHNRGRMIVGMFWTKYLLINPFDLKYGSQTGFSSMLVDAVGSTQNKMNHHWITEFDYPGKKFSSKGKPLSGRPMKISNDQIKIFDPDCLYIKKWLPHLKDIPNKDLYKWSKIEKEKYNNIHPEPIFDSKTQYEEWIKAGN